MPTGLGRHGNLEASGKGLPYTTGAECGLHKVVLLEGSSDDKAPLSSTFIVAYKKASRKQVAALPVRIKNPQKDLL